MENKTFCKLLTTGIVGVILGTFCSITVYHKLGFRIACIAGIIFFGLPYGWYIGARVINVKVNMNDIRVCLVVFIIRLYIALIIGWIVYPVSLIYYIIKSIYYKNSRL